MPSNKTFGSKLLTSLLGGRKRKSFTSRKIEFGNPNDEDTTTDEEEVPPPPSKKKKRLERSQLVSLKKKNSATKRKNFASDSCSSSSDSDDDDDDQTEKKPPATLTNDDTLSKSDDDFDDEWHECTQPTSNCSSAKTKARMESTTSSVALETTLDKAASLPFASSPNDQQDDATTTSDDQDTLPTIQALETQCWKCAAQFQVEGGQEFCLYAMHTHPLLKVPICSVCADQILAVETNVSTDNDVTECSGCACDVETLFLCDSCPRAFCRTCVACAHGGGSEGVNAANLLEVEDSKWNCLHCKPPPPLQKLQAHVERIGQEESESKPRSIQDIAEELYKVELERKIVEERLAPHAVELKRAEFRAELEGTLFFSHPEDIDTAVEAELEDWKQMWAQHDARLLDRVAPLQEEVESRGESLAGCYAAILGENTKSDSVEPEWKRAADAELQRRDEEEDEDDDAPLQNPSDPSVYRKDIPEDVEDLGSDTADAPRKKSQWRHNKRRATSQDVQEALHFEDEMLQQHNIPVLRVVNDCEDVEETKQEEDLASGRAADGTSRIRRDEIVVHDLQTQSRRQVKQRPAKKRRISSSSTEKLPPRVETNEPLDLSDISIDDAKLAPTSGNTIFDDSSLVLCSPNDEQPPSRSVRTISIAQPLAERLKDHQVDGIKFLWRNSFSDLAFVDPNDEDRKDIGGCILAHNMGLGKSLTCIALLHALLNHPSLLPNASTVDEPTRGLARTKNRRLIRTVLLIVPTNVISHWEEEWEAWTGSLVPSVALFNLSVVGKESRQRTVRSWLQKGGVLLVSNNLFVQIVKSEVFRQAFHDPGPDIVVADEAHTMLKTKDTKIFKALGGIKTPRRVALTGSPVQNNLFEYFRMVSWVRPGVLGNSEAEFDRQYANAITTGLASDASAFAVRTSNEASKELHGVLSPYVQRKDAKVLRKDLPPMQQVVLVARQTRTQADLYRAFQRHKKRTGLSNFFTSYQMIRPVHNHPSTLLMNGDSEQKGAGDAAQAEASKPAAKSREEVSVAAPAVEDATLVTASSVETDLEMVQVASDSEAEVAAIEQKSADAGSEETAGKAAVSIDSKDCPSSTEIGTDGEETDAESRCVVSSSLPPSGCKKQDPKKTQWWQKTVERIGGADKLKEVEQGYKIVLLLHILMEAQALGDKVVVFSQCLKTLDYIEYVLGLDDWKQHVPSLACSSQAVGGWKKNVDYLRIDGQTQFGERGDLIAHFNDEKSSSRSGNRVKAFLLSAQACGIGINLIAANRVVLFDNHFNPTVSTQALYRCYRYGQTKPVFAYRFMTEGTVEEKIYSRCVSKTGVSLRVIDNKSIQRSFTQKELRDLETTDSWVQCDACEKWRMLPANMDAEQLPDKWYCNMLTHDTVNNSCDASEKDARWYYRHLSAQLDILKESPVKCIAREEVDSALSAEEKAKLVANDVILQKLLYVSAREQQSSLISKHYFHEALLAETDEDQGVVGEKEAAFAPDDSEVVPQGDIGALQPDLSSGTIAQPDRESLIHSVDAIYATAEKTTSVGFIIKSLEKAFDVKFEPETKQIVKDRLMELVMAKPSTPPASTQADISNDSIAARGETSTPPSPRQDRVRTPRRSARTAESDDESSTPPSASSTSDVTGRVETAIKASAPSASMPEESAKEAVITAETGDLSSSSAPSTPTEVMLAAAKAQQETDVEYRAPCSSTPGASTKAGVTNGESDDESSISSCSVSSTTEHAKAKAPSDEPPSPPPAAAHDPSSPAQSPFSAQSSTLSPNLTSTTSATKSTARGHVSPKNEESSTSDEPPEQPPARSQQAPPKKAEVIDLLSDSSDEEVIEILSDED